MGDVIEDVRAYAPEFSSGMYKSGNGHAFLPSLYQLSFVKSPSPSFPPTSTNTLREFSLRWCVTVESHSFLSLIPHHPLSLNRLTLWDCTFTEITENPVIDEAVSYAINLEKVRIYSTNGWTRHILKKMGPCVRGLEIDLTDVMLDVDLWCNFFRLRREIAVPLEELKLNRTIEGEEYDDRVSLFTTRMITVAEDFGVGKLYIH
jgi:hypothetical protein